MFSKGTQHVTTTSYINKHTPLPPNLHTIQPNTSELQLLHQPSNYTPLFFTDESMWGFRLQH